MAREMDTMEDTFEFGKYKGKTVTEVMATSGSYIAWLIDAEVVTFSQECLDVFAEAKIV